MMALNVLLVCDEGDDDDNLLNQAVKHLDCTMSCVFGLKTAVNLSECTKGGVKLQLQLEEMTRSDMVVVVLSSETTCGEFNGLLEFIPSIRMMGPKRNNSVRVITTDAAGIVPCAVTCYETYNIEDFLKLNVVLTDAYAMVPGRISTAVYLRVTRQHKSIEENCLSTKDQRRMTLEATMTEYPCTFNITPEISDAKLREVKGKLRQEIQQQNVDKINDIRNRNLLTWIEYKLGDLRSAVQQNEDVLRQTGSTDMVALGNRVFLLKEMGQNYDSAFRELEVLSRRPDAGKITSTAKADQAYSYARIGGPKNQQYAIDLYTEALQMEPNNFHWKFGLGLALRRSIHKGMARSPEFRMSFAQRVQEGSRVLFEVAETEEQENLFRKRAFEELVFMWEIVEGQENVQGGINMNEVFHNMNKEELESRAKSIK